MKLDDYIEKSKKELEDLRKLYKKNHESDPENWPVEAEEGDWTEQELAYRF